MSYSYQISPLKEFPQLAEPLGKAIYFQWIEMYEFQRKTEREVIDTVISRAVDDRIPCTIIANNFGELLGSVTLKLTEGTEFPSLSPWLAGVFVLPQFRGLGVGTVLVQSVEKLAKDKFGVIELFLYTSTAKGLYEKLGYTVFSKSEKDGILVEYMKKRL